MRFCCNDFSFRHKASSEMGINIRVIKLSSDGTYKPCDKELPYRFFISSGMFNNSIRIAKIDFCPFCGSSLLDNYSDDQYINEVPEGLINK